ncbi:small subunit ribosomal protein S8 [Verrucomicrobium sp. GAS474]|uniref:30S ribosomal protein S8 n=1 Tax=Verrucomicrobium sp. GAS474 TaxID=1882831 RepID=UPI00087D0057|nr:30S ribosomal protein S8 [Verrucomicrobium sp. GAS474]SDU25932.1 small subunit ribosomal protein S8 [Verrucomicrobium sp. GAS474]
MQTDPLADFLSALRNASRASKAEVVMPYSRLKGDVANVLKEEGYLDSVEILNKDDNKIKPKLKVTLRGTAKIKTLREIKRISKPGLRRYVGAGEIPRVLGGLGVSVLSTPRGVMAGHRAKQLNVGGELLLTVY